MRLSITLESFTEADWQAIFGAYVKAHGSHWTGAPFAMVKKQLEEKSFYEFGFNSMGTWTSKFRLDVQEGTLNAIFVKNPELKGRMKEHLEKMEQIFEEHLSPYA
ncbi:MAG: hypothetical protein OXR66_00135 [Candidatus Woesearchaeota archaeon]|nr:hypothetical protein [Candidatus Woesearchaeota archaeon]